MIAMCLATLLGLPEASVHPIAVAVVAPRDVTDSLVNRICAEAEAIWDEAYIARALGRAFAHEMGHYILRSKVHTPRGLMRAAWTASQAFAISRDGFALTAEERAEAADNLRMELKRADSAP